MQELSPSTRRTQYVSKSANTPAGYRNVQRPPSYRCAWMEGEAGGGKPRPSKLAFPRGMVPLATAVERALPLSRHREQNQDEARSASPMDLSQQDHPLSARC